MMWALAGGMALLAAAALTVLLWPLRKRGEDEDVSRNALNAALYRDELEELVSDRASGALAETAFDQSAQELQSRARQDTAGETPAETAATIAGMQQKTPRRLLVVLAALIPVGATLLYLWLGTPRALDLANPPPVSNADIEAMVERLAARLKANPDDARGWVMLARSYKVLGRFEQSADAYSHLGNAVDLDPELLADYAEVLARKAEGDFSGKPSEMIARALTLDPDNAQALGLAGIAAYRHQDYGAAVDYLQRLQPKLAPDSEGAKTVAATIEQARKLAGLTAGPPPHPGGKGAVAAAAPVTPGASLRGRVSLAPALAAQVKADDTVFIYAKAEGVRMPLAVLRSRAGALPLAFTLDDRLAMSPQARLSALPPGTEVQVGARISRSGDARAKSGDLVGDVEHIKPGAGDLRVVIDRVLP